jgi:hypothetical protein
MTAFEGLVTDDPVINAESQVGTVIAICVSFSVASVFFLALRLYTRLGILRHWGPDDVTIVFAELCALLTAMAAGMGEYPHLSARAWIDTSCRGSTRLGTTHLDLICRGYSPTAEGESSLRVLAHCGH